MRTWLIISVGASAATLTLAARPWAPRAQPSSACAPVDSAPVRAWHAEWDTANLSRRALGPPDTVGLMTLSLEAGRRVPIAMATGTFALTVGWLRMARPDTFFEHTLQLWRPSTDEVRIMTRQEGFTARGTLLRGWLSSATHGPMDTATISGVLGPQRGMAFGRADAFDFEDGESYDVAEVDTSGFRGWYGGGAVVPTPLAYFCAVRIN